MVKVPHIPIRAYRVSKIEEGKNDEVILYLKKGLTVKTHKSQFKDYESYKKSVTYYNKS